MKDTISSVAALLLSVALLLMGNGLQGMLLPVRGSLEAFTNIQIGILGSAYYLGFTFGCLAGPSLIARAGHIRAYLALISIASTVALLHVLIVDPIVWWVFRGVTGFCLAVLYIVIESWLNERSTNETRGAIFAIYTIINLTVITIGQIMFTLHDPNAFPLFALVSILISLAAVPVAMTRAQSPAPIPFIVPNLTRLYSASPVGFVGCLAAGLVNGSIWALGPVFAINSGFETRGAALFMSAFVLGGAAGQWPIGRSSDAIDRRLVLLSVAILATVVSLLLNHLPSESKGYVLATAFCLGFFAFPLYSVAVAHTNDKAAPNTYVETSSGLLLVFGLGATTGPFLAALSDEHVARQSLFLFTAVIYFLSACFVLSRILQKAPTSDAEKGEFLDALVASKTLAPIDVADHADLSEGTQADETHRSP